MKDVNDHCLTPIMVIYMKNYKVTVHPNDLNKLFQYDVVADSEREARSIGLARYIEDHPDCSDNQSGYVIDISYDTE
jgi:hypothetical protein